MQTLTIAPHKTIREFLPFDLCRLLRTVFNPTRGENVCILIDLENPSDIVDFAFLQNIDLTIQRKAYASFYRELRSGVMQQLGLGKCDFFAYKTPHDSCALPETALTPDGTVLVLEHDIYPAYDIIISITTHPMPTHLVAAAKKHAFRGAVIPQLNHIILRTGLAVDYNEVGHETEKMRKGLTYADSISIDFELDTLHYHLHIDLAAQEAQKNYGICHSAPHIVYLPAGEISYLPRNVTGSFPMQFADGTIGLVQVDQNCAHTIILIRGDQGIIDTWQEKLDRKPSLGTVLKLGLGTQVLPFSGNPIQDKTILGSFYLCIGEEEILFLPTKTSDIVVKQMRMKRQGISESLLENDVPSTYLKNLLLGKK